jgi:uncharacterized protein (DUF58 family)
MSPPGRAGTPAPRRARGRPRPERLGLPLATSLVLLVLWGGVAHVSGSGWVEVVGGLVGGVLAVAMLGPALAAGRLDLSLLDCPTDATTGEVIAITLAASGPGRVRLLDPPGAAVLSRGGRVVVAGRPPRRGVLRAVRAEVATAAPFGLVWWHRVVELPLPRALHVAPAPGAVDTALCLPAESARAAGRARRPAVIGDLHQVRAYQHGDSPRRVHWPASAHAGRLMIREVDEPVATPTVVAAHPGVDAEADEERYSRALGTVLALLARGHPVLLETTEAGTTTRGPVTTRQSAGRRLARADPAGRS